MLLRHCFADHEINLTLEVFLREVRSVLGERLDSVILFGSVLFDDLAPGYGDFDFLAVVNDELTEEDAEQLMQLRAPFRSGNYGVLAHMLEGPFLSRRMLNPENEGVSVTWSTSREYTSQQNELGWLVLDIIRTHGLVIFGHDVRKDIVKVDKNIILKEIRDGFCNTLKRNRLAGTLHSIDFLLTAARMLLWLKEDRLSSKSDAAEWAFSHVDAEWAKFLPQAKQLRRHPYRAVQSRSVLDWLNSLETPIRQAYKHVLSVIDDTVFEG